jgi:hypothetical protein
MALCASMQVMLLYDLGTAGVVVWAASRVNHVTKIENMKKSAEMVIFLMSM